MAAKDLIIEYVEGQGITEKDELIAILENSIDIPEYEKLAIKYVATIANRIVSTLRNEKGERWVLAKRGADGTKYVNLKKCSDLNILKEIKDRYNKDIQGRTKSLKTVTLKISSVQLDMFEAIKKAPKPHRRPKQTRIKDFSITIQKIG